MLGFAQLLKAETENSLSTEQKIWIDYILSSGTHLLDLITDVLDFAQLSTGKLSIKMEPVEISKLVKECLSVTASIMEQKKIVVDAEHLTTCHIRADETRMRQVLLNLLSNSVKYNQESGTIRLFMSFEPEHRVRLTVEDSGIGIPENRQQEVFQPFNRLGRETIHSEGTGIGLVISKNLVERMSGRIGFDSREGVGSRFWIEFEQAAPEQL
ncbi:MAG: sensor histidine kinase [Gammaproteobacteria bacterium]